MEMKDLLEQLKPLLDEQRKNYDAQLANVFGFPSSEAREKALKLDAAVSDLVTKANERAEADRKRFDLVESEVNRIKKFGGFGGDGAVLKTLGQQFVESETFKNYHAANKTSQRVAVGVVIGEPFVALRQKAITGIVWPAPQPGIVALPQLRLGLRSLIPSGRTTQGSISYLRETAFTNAAAPVAEGAKKPESTKTLVPATSAVTTIAHLLKVSKQCWEDLPMLQSLIDANMLYGISLAEENQLLNGDGAPPNLQGLMPVAPAATAPGAGGTVIDAVLVALSEVSAAGFVPTGVVMNAVNWAGVQGIKTSQGVYLYGSPASPAPASLWGVPVVLSPSMAAGSFLVGAFNPGAMIYDREDANVEVANMNTDDFEKNMLTVRGEERLAFVINSTAAFRKGVVPAAAE